MDFGISQKVALVTGAAGGLGSAIANALAAEGACVIVADINDEAAEQVASAIRQQGGYARALQWDLGDVAGIPARLNALAPEWAQVDILVNNTGGPPPTLAQGVDTADWQIYFNSMVTGVIKLTDAVLPGMRSRRWGRIITSTSSGVVAPIPNLGISNTLRSALVGWSKTLSREVAADGVTANIILPGRIATQRIQQLDQARATREGRDIADVVQASVQSIPAGRYGRPEEYGKTVAFLASEAASYITGSVIRVDGGLIPSI
ncbi:MAG: SDR family oxidoreductase [Burkholderiaceae bacterium]|jgi:3-oxoacyl-[acyl-carrier protein] reductase